jgi:ferrous iron transport protein A
MTLHQAAIGSTARIRRLSGDPGLRERLAELGLTPGQTVRLLRRAPLGDPLELLIRGYRLAVRREEAEAVEVEPAA